jgi:cell division protein FtsW (lipid II flippase)
MKLFLIIALAKHLHDDPKSEGRTLVDLIVPTLVTLVPLLLILLQPDLGTALILGLIFLTVCLLTRIQKKSLYWLLGGTVVIGGIIITSQRVDISQVPLVGSLPLIGHLFRRTNTTTQSQELLFFLTPRIIPG